MIGFRQVLVEGVTGKTQKREVHFPRRKLVGYRRQNLLEGWEGRKRANGSLRLTEKAGLSHPHTFTEYLLHARHCPYLGGWGRAEKVGIDLAPIKPTKKNFS